MARSTGEEPGKRTERRSSIVAWLLAAFLLVSVLPIGTLAILALVEEQQVASEEVSHVESTGETSEGAEHLEPGGPEAAAHSVMGIPTTAIELGVAGVSLGIAVLMAFYVGRRIVRPLHELEAAMGRVEAGELGATAPVRSNDEIGRLARAFNRMVVGLRREVLIRDLFGQYVTPEVARIAIEHEGRLEGEEIECSIVFADIRGFTALSEVLPAHRLLDTLNRYLATMLREIANEGGIVNKFGGDSILAVFGSPLNPTTDHASRAVRAALRMRGALDAFNAEQTQEGLPEVHAGFGVATGDVVAGNIGSERKIEYTVIGDAVNLAARLEELTRELGEDILIAGATAKQVQTIVRLRPLGDREIRGRSGQVEVFAADALVAT